MIIQVMLFFLVLIKLVLTWKHKETNI